MTLGLHLSPESPGRGRWPQHTFQGHSAARLGKGSWEAGRKPGQADKCGEPKPEPRRSEGTYGRLSSSGDGAGVGDQKPERG